MTFWQPELERYPGPRYKAIAAAVAEDISGGTLQPGDRLPTHRQLAEALGVTVGTVTRGYAEAERQGLVGGRVGSGTYVLGDGDGHRVPFGIPAEAPTDGDVNFGLALPVPARRESMLADALRRLADDPAALHDTLSYQPEAGLRRHRDTLRDWLADWGVALAGDEVLLTLGGLHAVHLALQVLARPGETVATEALTYPGLIAAARQQHLDLQPVALDDEGMIPSALARLCEQRAVRAVYCVPNQNNPTTACMSEERRRELAAVARRYGVFFIEDEVHLVDGSERPPNLVDLAPERVLYVTSCSKILAGGLRVGILRAPGHLVRPLEDALRSHCWMAPPLNAELACRWITSGLAREIADWQRRAIGERQALAADRLAGHTFRAQPYGFNLWLHLPEPWRAGSFVTACASEGVHVKSGEPFAVGHQPVPEAIRLALSAPASLDDVRRGLDVVRGLLEHGPRPPSTL
ncbi:PLP-dependent aminotransferase family protein [Aquisalimonas lutea]|uniref:aminotransferase-like domain-containing protein n=1 Tax=Aquisalimonas lutea TaxID=1327750 RepID=UPI0025B3B10B|nr:PLP-dependent aminotransferase family protein [Aquisalimonas lutea]MDN3516222.1 PLP-dependent aminotransferase family protein [Aquisalimonas lutea]